MLFIPGICGLQLDQQRLLDHQVDTLLTDLDSVICDREPALLHSVQLAFGNDCAKSILINFLQETRTKRIEHGKCAADDAPDSSFSHIPSACIRVHPNFYLRKTFPSDDDSNHSRGIAWARGWRWTRGRPSSSSAKRIDNRHGVGPLGSLHPIALPPGILWVAGPSRCIVVYP
jgi:hypothetical protein